MKIKSTYSLRKIAGETIIVNQGKPSTDMTRIISLNSSAELLYNELVGKDFDTADVIKILTDTYSIDSDTATKDARKWVDSLRDSGIIEDNDHAS